MQFIKTSTRFGVALLACNLCVAADFADEEKEDAAPWTAPSRHNFDDQGDGVVAGAAGGALEVAPDGELTLDPDEGDSGDITKKSNRRKKKKKPEDDQQAAGCSANGSASFGHVPVMMIVLFALQAWVRTRRALVLKRYKR